MSRRELHAISNENSPFLFSRRSRILEPRRIPTAIHTLGSMSSAAAAADAPEEFAALAEYAVEDFMSAPRHMLVAKIIRFRAPFTNWALCDHSYSHPN